VGTKRILAITFGDQGAMMPDTTLPHPQGAVCWLDMLLAGQEEALNFYQPLFGWTGRPDPGDPTAYAVQTVRGKAVAGIGKMPESEAPMPWTGYFAVTDLDAAVSRITENGGDILVGASEAEGHGRFAHGTDPAGAHFGLWEAGPFPGFELWGEPGCMGWLELVTAEGKSSAEFYAALLECSAEPMEQMPDAYWTLHADGQPRAGILQAQESKRPYWRPYFLVDDPDQVAQAAERAGARVVSPPADTPFGRMAALHDPNGIEIRITSIPEMPASS
jgi:predicted enzyme related to lactoylglutathione lyase